MSDNCTYCDELLVGDWLSCEDGEFCHHEHAHIWRLETEHTAQRKEIAVLENDLERGFEVLEMYGIPKARARTVDNGIQVFDTRLQRERQGLKHRIEELEEMLGTAIGDTDLRFIDEDQVPAWLPTAKMTINRKG